MSLPTQSVYPWSGLQSWLKQCTCYRTTYFLTAKPQLNCWENSCVKALMLWEVVFATVPGKQTRISFLTKVLPADAISTDHSLMETESHPRWKPCRNMLPPVTYSCFEDSKQISLISTMPKPLFIECSTLMKANMMWTLKWPLDGESH